MAYASWSVVFGEQPSAAKWNILGTNDSSFNDGTGIANLTWATTSLANPYKFRGRRAAAFTPGSSGAFVLMPYDTEDYDSNSNFDSVTNKGRYTAPVAGFYNFSASVNCASSPTTFLIIALYKNGSIYQRGNQLIGANAMIAVYSDTVQAAANDYFEIFVFMSAAVAMDVNTGSQPYFSGVLVSKT